MGAGRRARPDHAVDVAAPLVIDIDATLVTAHSEKERAAPTFERGFGLHPLWTFLDHGPAGSGEPLAVMLRAGNAGSNTAADHITVARQALAQLPSHRSGHRGGRRPGRKILIRTDGAGASHEFLDWLHRRRLSYSIGFGLPEHAAELADTAPAAPTTRTTPGPWNRRPPERPRQTVTSPHHNHTPATQQVVSRCSPTAGRKIRAGRLP